MTLAGHGVNVGHGYVKYIILDPFGKELDPVVFPAMIGRSERNLAGTLRRTDSVEVGGARYWTGDDALISNAPITMLAQDRLMDAVFIPALVKGAMQRFGHLNGSATSSCVTGLPATWSSDVDKAKLLAERLRAATPYYQKMKVIAEPLGLVYSALLDNNGQIAGDPALHDGQVGVVDLGHLTVDIAVIKRLTPVPSSLDTWQLGTSRPLQEVRSQLSARFERELNLHETDLAVRSGSLMVAGQPRSLPSHWDRPLVNNGEQITNKLVDAWGKGAQLACCFPASS